MKLRPVTRERAEAIAHEQAMAYLGTVMHVIQNGDDHFILHDEWVSGEVLIGTRVSSWIMRELHGEVTRTHR